jgi:5-methylcytosine-specific restriction endonuclease McrA
MTEEDTIQQRINRVINVSPPARMDIREHGKYMERILKECISIEDFCEEDRKKAIKFFTSGDKPSCVYCGESELALGWDHLVPAIRGGDIRLGNMVPSCRPCNASKGRKTYQEWLDCDTPKSLKGREEEFTPDYIEVLRQKLSSYMDEYEYSVEGASIEYKLEAVRHTPEGPSIETDYYKLLDAIGRLVDDLTNIKCRYTKATNDLH